MLFLDSLAVALRTRKKDGREGGDDPVVGLPLLVLRIAHLLSLGGARASPIALTLSNTKQC